MVMCDCECSFSEFVENNSTFILTFTGLLTAAAGTCLVFLLKSRCTHIQCCGFSCERQVLSEDAVTQQVELNNHTAGV